jgi:hypothetical protein
MSTIQIPYTKNPNNDEEAYSFRRGRPFLFQVVMPGTNVPLYKYLLALHTNPRSVDEKMTKGKTVVPTYGGFVEFVWPDDFDTISCSHSTGAFINADSSGGGLSSGGDIKGDSGIASDRKGTIAWERQEDLLELFHNNGMVYDSRGIPAIRGRIMMIYDRGIFIGHFTSFQVTEDDSHAFSFELSWEFKVEQVLYRFPTHSDNIGPQ